MGRGEIKYVPVSVAHGPQVLLRGPHLQELDRVWAADPELEIVLPIECVIGEVVP